MYRPCWILLPSLTGIVISLAAPAPLFAATLIGQPDPVQSQATFALGSNFVDLVIEVQNAQGQPVTGNLSVTVEHAASSSGLSFIGLVLGLGNGRYGVALIPSAGPGTDRFVVTIDDGLGPVVLSPLPELCIGNVAAGISDDCNGNGYADECEIIMGFATDLNGNGVLDACESFVRGDCNRDQQTDFTDVVRLLNFLFGAGGAALDCASACDANDDGLLDVSDASRLVQAVFGMGPGVPPPAPQCGLDPTPDLLTCPLPHPCP